MDAIALLEDDHRMLEALFRQYEGEGDMSARRALVERVVAMLRLHSRMEEAVFYPRAREATPGSAGLTDEALRQHEQIDKAMAEVQRLRQDDPGHHMAVLHLRDVVVDHVIMEEAELFSAVAAPMGKEVLEEVGARMEEMRSSSARVADG